MGGGATERGATDPGVPSWGLLVKFPEGTVGYKIPAEFSFEGGAAENTGGSSSSAILSQWWYVVGWYLQVEDMVERFPLNSVHIAVCDYSSTVQPYSAFDRSSHKVLDNTLDESGTRRKVRVVHRKICERANGTFRIRDAG